MFCARDRPLTSISEGAPGWPVTEDMKWLHAEYRQRLGRSFLQHSEEQDQRRWYYVMCNPHVVSDGHCRAVQETESNIRTKSSNQDKQFSIESLLGKEICRNICMVSTTSSISVPTWQQAMSIDIAGFDKLFRMIGEKLTKTTCLLRILLLITCLDHHKSNLSTDKCRRWVRNKILTLLWGLIESLKWNNCSIQWNN